MVQNLLLYESHSAVWGLLCTNTIISHFLGWTGRLGMLQFMGLQRVRHDWATELNWTDTVLKVKCKHLVLPTSKSLFKSIQILFICIKYTKIIWFWLEKFCWRRKWWPTPVFLPGKSYGQRSLAGYSPWSHKRVGHDFVTKQQQQSQYGSPN